MRHKRAMLYKERREQLRGEIAVLRIKEKRVTKWRARIAATGLSMSQWCAKHGFDKGDCSKWCSGAVVPEWDTVDRVEAILTKEEV